MHFAFLLTVAVAAPEPGVPPLSAPDSAEAEGASANVEAHLVIVAAATTPDGAIEAGRAIASKAGVPFSTRGLLVKDDDLRFPEDHDDEAYAGGYLLRRIEDDCGMSAKPNEGVLGPCLTVERSSAYPGLKPGLFLVLARITDRNEAASAVAAWRKIVPGAYAARTTIYMGCMH